MINILIGECVGILPILAFALGIYIVKELTKED